MSGMRSDIYQLWAIQESLLQQYRVIATTLLGLISAGILVAASNISDNWNDMSGYIWKWYSGQWSILSISNFIYFCLLIVLIYLGFRSIISFRRITTARERMVTFAQDMLIAEENHIIEDVCQNNGIKYPTSAMTIFRAFQRGIDFELLDIEHKMKLSEIDIIIKSIYSNNINRHHFTRKFMSKEIYDVFRIFFSISAIYSFLAAVNLLAPQ